MKMTKRNTLTVIFFMFILGPFVYSLGQGTIITTLPTTLSGSLDAEATGLTGMIWGEFEYSDYIIYDIDLESGDAINLLLEISGDADFDLFFYYAVDNNIENEYSSTNALNASESLWVMVGITGTHSIFVGAYDGAGSFTLTIEEATSSPLTLIGTVLGIVAFILIVLIIGVVLIRRRFRQKIQIGYPYEERHFTEEKSFLPDDDYVNIKVGQEELSEDDVVVNDTPIVHRRMKDYSTSDSDSISLRLPIKEYNKTSLRFCEYCGAPMPPNAKKCPYCKKK